MSGNLLYPLLSNALILGIIFITYLRKTGIDHFQRKVYFSVLAFILAAIVTHFAGTMLEGRTGRAVHILLVLIFNLYIVLQQCSYYAIVVFLDYLLNKNSTRTRQFIYISAGILAINIFILAGNYFKGFYFFISDSNYYSDGSLFLIRFYMSYSAVLMFIIDIFLSLKQLRAAEISIITSFALVSGTGAVLDIVLPGGNFVWVFLTGAMLIAYFYILYSDATRDAVTGIGNRSSFIEFVKQTVKPNNKQSYNIILFDLDDLNKININFGTSVGDRALAEMAALLKKCTRWYDFIARIGSDEFLVAVKEQFDINRLIERILQALDALNKEPDRQYALSVKYGYSLYTANDYQLIDDFLQGLSERVFRNRDEQHEGSAVKRRGLMPGK